MSFSAYVICATPRSGSTLLCDLLSGSGVAGEPHSYFRSEDIAYWAGLWSVAEPISTSDRASNQAYLSAMVRAGTGRTGRFGLRLMWGSVGEATERLCAALSDESFPELVRRAFGPTLFIHLSRRDKVAQAISLVRARQTGLWHLAADGSKRERTGPARPPAFDADRISQTRDRLIADDASWSSLFDHHAIDPMRLTYETLADRPREALAAILIALGRDPAVADGVDVRTAKMADATNMDWAARSKSSAGDSPPEQT